MNWIRRNWRYFAVFGAFALTIAVVSLVHVFEGQPAKAAHVWIRQELHLAWAYVLVQLFTRLQMVVERQRGRPIPFGAFYAIPFSLVLGIALNQEFGIPGDYRNGPDPIKSFADIAGWSFGALASTWYEYFARSRLFAVGNDALAWKKRRQRRHEVKSQIRNRSCRRS